MPRMVFVFLSLIACAGDPIADSDSDLPADSDVDTDSGEALPLETGSWQLEFQREDSDGCGMAALGFHRAIFSAGGEDFLIDVAEAPVGPASFDCNLRGFTFTCQDADGRVLQGTLSGRDACTGSFRDESCGSVYGYVAVKD